MEIEVLIMAMLASLATITFLYGVRALKERKTNYSRFAAGYDDQKSAIKVNKKRTNRMPLNKGIFFVLVGGITIGIASYAVLGILWLSIIASFSGFFVPYAWLKWHDASQQKAISSQLEQAVEIMGSVIRSSGGVVSALKRAAQTVGSPLDKDLLQVASEIELGVSPGDAFKNLAVRVPMQETKMISMVMEIQQSGMAVNLASVFEQIQINIRGKQALQEEIRALTVENKMAGWIVAAVPFATIGIIRWTSPDFTAPLFTTPIGLTIFLISTGLIGIGVFWIMKMANMADV